MSIEQLEEFQSELVLLINKCGIDNLVNMSDRDVAYWLLERLLELVQTGGDLVMPQTNEDGDDSDPGEMDGDHASALASIGWGPDEEYGGEDERI